MDILNNRDFSIILWFVIFILLVIYNDKNGKVKNSVIAFLKAFFVPKLLVLHTALLTYTVGLVAVLSMNELWKISELKGTVLWFFTFAIASATKFEKIKNDPKYYKKSVLEGFTLTAIITFFIGEHVFPFYVEIILQPLIMVLALVSYIATRQEETKIFKPIAEWTLFFIVIAIIGLEVREVYADFEKINAIETLNKYLIPIYLTIGYLPCLAVVMAVFAYEKLPLRLNHSIKDQSLLQKSCRYALFRFHFKFTSLYQWTSSLVFREIDNFNDVQRSIDDFFYIKRSQILPRHTPKEIGWPAYFAIRFLSKHGLKTDYYHPVYDNEWFAQSNVVSIGDKVYSADAHYSILGDRRSVKKLTLTADTIYPENEAPALSDFIQLADTLIYKSTKLKIDDRCYDNLRNSKNIELELGNFYRIIIKKRQGAGKVYGLELSIGLLDRLNMTFSDKATK